MADNKGNSSNQTPNNWEDAADKATQNQPVKTKKPLKLSSGAKAFNPGEGSANSFNSFVPNYPQGQQGGFQPYQPNYQPGYQPGAQQGGFQQYQPNYQQGGFSGNQPQFQPSNQKQQEAPTQTTKPNPQTQQTSNTQAKPQTANTQQNKPKEPEPKKDTKKAPEPKVEPKKETKETKKGGKVDKKTASDAQGKKKEEKKEGDTGNERSFVKLQTLMAAQKNMKIDKVDWEASTKDKAKYDDLVDEERQPMSIVFIGHVDAGKSTTCGNILLLTGQVDQADVRKLKQEAKEKNRESWWIAYLMDIGEEEKAKGKTVEVGKARFNTTHKRLTVLDAPGHKNYVPNMIAGASQADVAALVISAKTGEFESGFEKGGQTTEHAMLAKSLGVKHLILLINKMDEPTINWSQNRYDYIKKQLLPFLINTCGYDESNLYWIPYSALNGDNMKEGITDPRGSWYKGPTFFEILDNLPLPQRDPEGPVRIPVLDKFKDGGNLFVFGKVESGTIVHSSKLTLVPIGETVTIHAIYNDDDKRIPYAKPGEGVKLHIKGIEDDYINRGDIISSPYSFPYICNEFEAEIRITDLPEHKAIMSTGYTCVIHIHSAMEEVYVKDVKSEYNKIEEVNKPAKYLKVGSTGIVVISTKSTHPICCEKAEVMPHLGDFTLRDEGKTIASGRILRVKPVVKV